MKFKGVIYIIGKYRASTEYGLKENIQEAEEAAIRLWRDGWVVICPHKNTAFFGGTCPDETFLEGDLVILARCDAVYLLPNWIRSEGAKVELELAQELGLEIIYGEENAKDRRFIQA